MSSAQPKRVLVHGLTNNLAGTEKVISTFAQALEGEVRFDFVVPEEPMNYAGLFASGDNRFFVVPQKRTNLMGYYGALRRIFDKYSHEYAAVWSNLNILNNIDLLRYGYRYGIPRRILHSHNSHDDGRLHQRVLTEVHKRTVWKYVTDRWACSREAGEYMFLGRDFIVLPNAIRAKDYRFDPEARGQIRSEWGITDGTKLYGCVGRLVEQKNYPFLLSLWPSLLQREPHARLVIVGDGELRGELGGMIRDLRISDSVMLLGSRGDVPAWLSAFDVFVMPSLFEGLPVSLLEAQFNGLPCIVSDSISNDSVISSGTCLVPLSNPSAWVTRLAAARRPESAGLLPSASAYDIDNQREFLRAAFIGIPGEVVRP